MRNFEVVESRFVVRVTSGIQSTRLKGQSFRRMKVHSYLLGHFRREITSCTDSVRFGQITARDKKSRDKKHDGIVCRLWQIDGFFSLRSKKCTLYEIMSIIKSLVNSNFGQNPLKRKKIFVS